MDKTHSSVEWNDHDHNGDDCGSKARNHHLLEDEPTIIEDKGCDESARRELAKNRTTTPTSDTTASTDDIFLVPATQLTASDPTPPRSTTITMTTEAPMTNALILCKSPSSHPEMSQATTMPCIEQSVSCDDGRARDKENINALMVLMAGHDHIEPRQLFPAASNMEMTSRLPSSGASACSSSSTSSSSTTVVTVATDDRVTQFHPIEDDASSTAAPPPPIQSDQPWELLTTSSMLDSESGMPETKSKLIEGEPTTNQTCCTETITQSEKTPATPNDRNAGGLSSSVTTKQQQQQQRSVSSSSHRRRSMATVRQSPPEFIYLLHKYLEPISEDQGTQTPYTPLGCSEIPGYTLPMHEEAVTDSTTMAAGAEINTIPISDCLVGRKDDDDDDEAGKEYWKSHPPPPYTPTTTNSTATTPTTDVKQDGRVPTEEITITTTAATTANVRHSAPSNIRPAKIASRYHRTMRHRRQRDQMKTGTVDGGDTMAMTVSRMKHDTPSQSQHPPPIEWITFDHNLITNEIESLGSDIEEDGNWEARRTREVCLERISL